MLLVIEGKVHRPRPIHVMLSDLCAPRPFSDIKSVTVGQLVTVIGYVVRVTASRPMVIEGSFKCPKCGQYTQKYFRDGLFSPPNVCGTDK